MTDAHRDAIDPTVLALVEECRRDAADLHLKLKHIYELANEPTSFYADEGRRLHAAGEQRRADCLNVMSGIVGLQLDIHTDLLNLKMPGNPLGSSIYPMAPFADL